jgi:hypothetical protein
LYFESCDDFCFSGYRNQWIRILPLSHHIISAKLYPLKEGYGFLPKLGVSKKIDALEKTDTFPLLIDASLTDKKTHQIRLPII